MGIQRGEAGKSKEQYQTQNVIKLFWSEVLKTKKHEMFYFFHNLCTVQSRKGTDELRALKKIGFILQNLTTARLGGCVQRGKHDRGRWSGALFLGSHQDMISISMKDARSTDTAAWSVYWHFLRVLQWPILFIFIIAAHIWNVTISQNFTIGSQKERCSWVLAQRG